MYTRSSTPNSFYLRLLIFSTTVSLLHPSPSSHKWFSYAYVHPFLCAVLYKEKQITGYLISSWSSWCSLIRHLNSYVIKGILLSIPDTISLISTIIGVSTTYRSANFQRRKVIIPFTHIRLRALDFRFRNITQFVCVWCLGGECLTVNQTQRFNIVLAKNHYGCTVYMYFNTCHAIRSYNHKIQQQTP